MEDMLKTLEFTDIVHYKSSSVQYPVCLSKATIDILKTYDEPVLILDDDIVYTGVKTDILIPHGIDAIYCGLSCQSASNIHSMFERYSDSYVRILNMLTSHAILYISRSYKDAVIEILETNMNRVLDGMMTRIQSNYQILALKTPIFYQSMEYNLGAEFDVELHTKIRIVTTDYSEIEQPIYKIVPLNNNNTIR
jgi:hypothetical protein